MTLRTKTLLIIGLTLVGLVVLQYVFIRSLWLDGFRDLEEEKVREAVRQTLLDLEAEQAPMAKLAGDYAGWDDTYHFIETRDPAYIASNLVDETFADLRLNLIAFLDRAGTVVFAKAFDLAGGVAVAVPDVFLDVPGRCPPLVDLPDTRSRVDGLLRVDEGAMQVSARPIITSDKEGPIRGTLIMGRYLDEEARAVLEDRSGNTVSFWIVGDEALPASVQAPLAALRDGAGAAIRVQSDRIIAGYGLQNDLQGAPLLLVHVELRRDIHQQGQRTFTYLIVSVILIGLVLGGITVGLLECVVLRRISRLSRDVRRIGESGDPSVRVPAAGRDEVARLGDAINVSLEALERSQGALQYIGSHARCVLWQATVERPRGGRLVWDFAMQDEAAAERLLPLDVFIGGSYAHAWRRGVHKEDQERTNHGAEDAITSGKPSYSHEFRLRTRDGVDHWIQEDVDIEKVAHNRWRLVGVCTDVTARKHAESELQRARDTAVEISRMKSDFLANVSHEIRTPMNGILGTTELLRDTELTAEQREYLDLIGSSADSLLRVINDVLDFSKIEAGRLELDADDFELRATVGEALNLLAVRAHQRGLELACDIPADVPDALVGDGVRLRQILVNLVGNAAKFTREGEIVVRIAARPVDERQTYLHFTVADTGIGIPEEKKEVIFHAFRQADSSTTREYGGTGLGLAISSQLAQRMHGRMWVESEVGEGSAFHFTALFRTRPSAPVPPELLPAPALEGLAALVVDDNDTNLPIVEAMLEQLGMRVRTATDAAGALAAVEAARRADDPPAVVVCDAGMPGTSGFDLAARLRADAPERPIVMMVTAVDRAGDAARCRELGIDAVVSKPVRAADLLAAVLAALGLSEEEEVLAVNGGRGRRRSRGLRILLAEDNAVNQQVALRLLERHGHRVTVVDDGVDALDAIGRDPYDLLLMDVQMPRMSGFEAATEVRSRERGTGRRVPIIAMTAHALRGDRERCLEAGMDGYVAKPINQAELFDEIARLLPDTMRDVIADETIGTGTDASSLYDEAAAIARLGGDRTLFEELVELLVAEYPNQRSALRKAIRENDLATVQRVAHAMRGALGNFMADSVSRAAQTLEDAAAAGHGEEARQALHELEHLFEGLRSEFAARRREPSA